MYTSPPPTPPGSPPPHSSRSHSHSGTSSHHSHSNSHSQSRSHSRSSSVSRPESPVPDTRADSAIKTSLVFLGTVAAATFAAHKFWPKGITYGDKEDWEMEKAQEKAHQKVKQDMREDKARARRDEGPNRRRDRGGHGDRETRRAMYREGSGRESERSASSVETGRGYVTYERTSERDGSSRSGSRDRRSIRDRDDEEERYSQSSRRGSRYYPPAPARYAAEPSQPAVVSRRSSLEPARRSRYYDDAPQPEPDVIYVPRGAAYADPRTRRASLDRGRPRSYYDDDYR